MTPEQFGEIARVLPEPLLLITLQGEILTINKPVTTILGLTNREIRHKMLFDLVTEPQEKVINYLQACSRSRQMVLGCLTFRQADGQELICRCEGALLQTSSPASNGLNILRLENRASANIPFIQLNQKIDELGAKFALMRSEAQLRQKTKDLEQTLCELRHTQSKLIQSEKMSSLGRIVAGVAHEINNPISFIYGNIIPANLYAQDLVRLIELYQKTYPNPTEEIVAEAEAIELHFLKEDFGNLLKSIEIGAERIREIVLSLRNFSRLDEAEFKAVDIHVGIDSTLLILQNRFKSQNNFEINLIKEYSSLPHIDCYASQMNQVFMNIIANAIDALEEKMNNNDSGLENNQKPIPWIRIRTSLIENHTVRICIADNGLGIPSAIQSKLFDPFFTTKKVGSGTGLGLSVSYQIVVDKHGGKLYCQSEPGKDTEFIIEIPITQA